MEGLLDFLAASFNFQIYSPESAYEADQPEITYNSEIEKLVSLFEKSCITKLSIIQGEIMPPIIPEKSSINFCNCLN